MLTLRADFSKNVPSVYSIFVTFSYNAYYVNLMKSMPKRYYNATTKEWEIPYSCYENLIGTLNAYNIGYNVTEFLMSIEDLKTRVEKSKAITETKKEIDTSKVRQLKYKTTPRDYQLAGIAYGLETDKFLLADEQGLGKSLQCVNIARLNRGGQHCLIIVGYDALQFNWVEEIRKHSNEDAYVLGQREIKTGKRKGKVKLGNLKERMEDLNRLHEIEPFFIITSVVTLREAEKIKYTDKQGKERSYNKYIYAEKIEELCQKGIIGRVIVDESQVCKNITSNQTEALLHIKSCKYKIAATGTPLMNQHIDLYPLLVWLDQESCNYWTFREKYCVMGGYKNKQVVGNKNGDILNRKLANCMLRRKKDDVLDLPDKIIINEVLEMEGKQSILYEKTKGIVKHQIAKLKGNKTAILSALIALRKITCYPAWIDPKFKDSIKFDRVFQLMDEITQNGQKAIIFSNWATPVQVLYEQLKMYNPAMIIGDTKDRIEQVNKFQQDSSCKVILGTIGAMGTGLTLTAASNVIFLDEPWNRALKDQATDRAHRIGTKNNVNIYTLICKGTMDEFVHNKVISKGIIADNVVDGISLEELQDLVE